MVVQLPGQVWNSLALDLVNLQVTPRWQVEIRLHKTIVKSITLLEMDKI